MTVISQIVCICQKSIQSKEVAWRASARSSAKSFQSKTKLNRSPEKKEKKKKPKSYSGRLLTASGVGSKNSWSSDVGQLRYVAQKMAKSTVLKATYLSCPTSELHEFFFGNSPMTEVNMVFYGPCLGTSPVLRKWAWKKPWKSKNAKKCHFP